MSGYIGLNRTGFGPFDDSLSLIEEAGDSYHHTSKWLDEGWNGEKPYIDRINESIEFAANSYSDLIDALTALKAELREICAAIDDPACDLTLTTVECIKKLKAENESLRKDAERYRWLRDATGETPLRPAAFGNEMYHDMRLKLDFPTIVSYDAVGNVTTLDQAIDAMAQGEK